jgi:hypothetical protein
MEVLRLKTRSKNLRCLSFARGIIFGAPHFFAALKMKLTELYRYRILNQHLVNSALRSPQQVVNAMLSMQSQEYAMAKWAIGLRLPGSNNGTIEKAFNEQKILRTHVLRPTWHFVTAADIRWLLMLTAPRVHAVNTPYYKKYGQDKKLFSKVNTLLKRILRDKTFLTRTEIQAEFEKKKIPVADGIAMAGLLMQAELDGLICSGPRKGKQFTYALLDELVPPQPEKFDRTHALSELVKRFYLTRGPATIRDCSTWSGLTIADIRKGIQMNDTMLEKYTFNEVEYYCAKGLMDTKPPSVASVNFPLPDYDEYGGSYKYDSFSLNAKKDTKGNPPSIFSHALVIEGLICGGWKQTRKGNTVEISLSLPEGTSSAQQKKMDKAIGRYKNFFEEAE